MPRDVTSVTHFQHGVYIFNRRKASREGKRCVAGGPNLVESRVAKLREYLYIYFLKKKVKWVR